MRRMVEWTSRCGECRLRWIVFGGKPVRCAFCGSKLVKAKEAPRG